MDLKARKAKLYFDIVSNIDLIEEFIGPLNLFDEYSVDRKTKSAIERQLSIIGEAVKGSKTSIPMNLFNIVTKSSALGIY